ncbi:hypothetical protein SVIO_056570 [Streptomyces violaceusniger]|uniref:Uncharacterized protein n=1 Tax=Streptomyces violaceusniger TaxID=68280 RepID=A0A4D4L3Q7_STRVO|nr:hypothetical protein SVIO_056570 [Streptomyces violaceusniger]
MQLDQAGDILDQLIGVLELRHPVLGHLRPHHLVVVEGDPAVLLEAARLGLADVMQQRGQPQRQIGALGLQVDGLVQHRQRVLIDILVAVVLIALQAQRRKLRQDAVGEPRLHQQPQPLAGVVGQDELVELITHPLRRDDVDALGHRRHRGDHLGGHLEVELRREARGTHHPQRIVGEGLLGRSRGAQHPGGEIFQTVVRVDELLLWKRHRHRVDREVPTDQVLLDGVAVRHLGLPGCPVIGF